MFLDRYHISRIKYIWKIPAKITAVGDTSDATTSSIKFENTEKMLSKKVKVLQQKIRHRNKKIESKIELNDQLKKNGNSSDNLNMVMEYYFKDFALELVIYHQHENTNKAPQKRTIQPNYERICTNIYFYSLKAYKFVGNHFHSPNLQTIRNWLSNFNCEPGFLYEVRQFLKGEMKISPSLIDCALIFDAMSIYKQYGMRNKADMLDTVIMEVWLTLMWSLQPLKH